MALVSMRRSRAEQMVLPLGSRPRPAAASWWLAAGGPRRRRSGVWRMNARYFDNADAVGSSPLAAPDRDAALDLVWLNLLRDFHPGPPTDLDTLPPVTVGSICAGMGTESWAYQRLPWRFCKAFWCEKDPAARRFLNNNFPDVPNWSDCMGDDFVQNAPPCNVLTAGFPCQPFSTKGMGKGVNDPRGIVIISILKYVQRCRPQMLLLENVKGLVYHHRPVLDEIVGRLEALGYTVTWRLMETHLFSGLPHKRPRVFIMAFDQLNSADRGWPASGGRQGAITVNWPRPIERLMSLTELLDPWLPEEARNCYHHSKSQLRNMVAAKRIIRAHAPSVRMPEESVEAVVDLGGSRVQVGFETIPCLTKTRGQSFAFWSHRHQRPLNVAEMCRMQGLSIRHLNLAGITDKDLGGMLGNAYPCTVIARLMSAGLKALMAAHGMAILLPDATNDGTRQGYDSWRGILGKDGIPRGYMTQADEAQRMTQASSSRASRAAGGASCVRASASDPRASGQGGRGQASGRSGRGTPRGGLAAGGRPRRTMKRPASGTPLPVSSRRRTTPPE